MSRTSTPRAVAILAVSAAALLLVVGPLLLNRRAPDDVDSPEGFDLELVQRFATDLEQANAREPVNVPQGGDPETIPVLDEPLELATGPFRLGCETMDEVPEHFRPDRTAFVKWMSRWYETGVEEMEAAGVELPTTAPNLHYEWQTNPTVRRLWYDAQAMGFLTHQVDRYEMRERMRLDQLQPGKNLDDELRELELFLVKSELDHLQMLEAAHVLSVKVQEHIAQLDPIPPGIDEQARLAEYAATARNIGSTPEERFLAESIRRAQRRAILRIGDQLDRTTPRALVRRALDIHFSWE